MVDRLSKSAQFMPLSHPYIGKRIDETFFEVVVKLHCLRDRLQVTEIRLHGHFWKEFFKMCGTQLNMSSAYHPQIDSQLEVTNHYVE